VNTVTLHCELGDHTWERESQRGRRPASCPDCVAAETARAESERAASEPPARNWERVAETAMDAIGTLGAETDRKVTAALQRVMDTNGEQYYVDTLTDLIRPRRGIYNLSPDWRGTGHA
jgi:hypothetical protein